MHSGTKYKADKLKPKGIIVGAMLMGCGNVLLRLMLREYDKIVIVVNIYQAVKRKQHFGLIENAFIRLVDARNNNEMCKYNLTENYSGMTAMIFGEVYRYNGEWKFSAMGQGTNDPGLLELSRRYS